MNWQPVLTLLLHITAEFQTTPQTFIHKEENEMNMHHCGPANVSLNAIIFKATAVTVSAHVYLQRYTLLPIFRLQQLHHICTATVAPGVFQRCHTVHG